MTDLSIEVPKPNYGRIVLFQKNGDEPRDNIFILTSKTCVIGCFETADIQISSATESLVHCELQIEDESTGEASFKVFCSEIQINGTAISPVTTIKLKHKDVITVGGQRLQFEYPSAECKSIPTNSVDKSLNSLLKNEIVEINKNEEMFNDSSDKEKQERILPPCTSSNTTQRIWDHFWPFFNRKKFHNNHPSITAPIESTDEKVTTVNCPTSEPELIRPCIKPLIEEDAVVSERPIDQLVTVNETSECDGQYVDNSIISDNENAISAVSSVIEEKANNNPSALSEECPNLPTPTNLFSNILNKFNMFKKNVPVNVKISPVVAMSNQKEKEEISFPTEDMSEKLNSQSIDENKMESKEEDLSETLSQDQSFKEETFECDELFVNHSITPDERNCPTSEPKLIRPCIKPSIEEDGVVSERPIDQLVTVNETSEYDGQYVDNSIISDNENAISAVSSVIEEQANNNPLALSEECPNLPTPTNLFSNKLNKLNMFNVQKPVVAMPNQKEKDDISLPTEDMSEKMNSQSINENKMKSKEEDLSETLSQDQSFKGETLECNGLFVNNSITSDEQNSINETSSVDGLGIENFIASYVEISTSGVSVDETTSNSPSSDLSVKYSDYSTIADVENSFIDAMSIMEKDEMISHFTEDISEKSTEEDMEEVGSSSPKSLIEGFKELLKTHKNVQTIPESSQFDNTNKDGVEELLETPYRLMKNSTVNQLEKAELIELSKNEARLFTSVVRLTRCDALVKSPSQLYSTSSSATNRTESSSSGGEDSEEKLVLVRRSLRHRRPPRNIQTDTTPLVKGASRQTYARRVKSESFPFDIFDSSEDSLDEDAEPKKVTAYRTAVKRKMVEELQTVPNRRSKMSLSRQEEDVDENVNKIDT